MATGSLIALLLIVTIALLVVRVEATSLMMTGLSWDTANFQAYSAVFGVGFTTREAEMVVNHPVRRRIIRHLILAGNIGLTSALATVVVTFVQTREPAEVMGMVGLVLAGIIVLVLLGKLDVMRWLLDPLIRRALAKSGAVRALDYELLLRVQSGYCISEVEIFNDHLLAGKALGDSRPADLGLIVLGITRTDGTFIGAPNRDEVV